jgi:capsular polysaccharide biosynthesis protein
MIHLLGAPERLIKASRQSRVLAEALGIEIIPEALMLPCAAHELRIYEPSDRSTFPGWKAGVYDREGEVCTASLIDRQWTPVTVAFERHELPQDGVERLRGEAVYGGLLFRHFGHFLLESTCRLWWPLHERFTGPILFHDPAGGAGLPDYAARFFDLLGISEQIHLVRHPVRFDRVIVPHRSFVIQKEGHPWFRTPFLLAGAAAERGFTSMSASTSTFAKSLYLSRARVPGRRMNGEDAIESALAAAGFEIINMETRPLEQQIFQINRHERVAGIAGSAMHNVLFASNPKSVIYICVDREINLNFFIIDELMNNGATYIYNGPTNSPADARTLDEIRKDRRDGEVKLDVPKILGYLQPLIARR